LIVCGANIQDDIFPFNGFEKMLVKVGHSNAKEKVLKKGPNTIVCSAFHRSREQ